MSSAGLSVTSLPPLPVALAAVLLLANGCRDTPPPSGDSAQQSTGTEAPVRSDSTDWKAVDQAMGRSGKLEGGGVYRYSMPRSDLRVRAAGVPIEPPLALGSWLAFRVDGGKTLAMGDLVLAENEIAPVMRKLQEMEVGQSALHNHLLYESPRVMYLHIHASGDPVKIAQAVHAALELTKTPPPKPQASDAAPAAGLDTAALRRALGYSGKLNGGVYQVSVPRAEMIREEGMEVPPAMGVATAMNFQPTGEGRAAVTGDFVMTAGEVNLVLKALSAAGITVTALHNHLLNEQPRLFFAHFWGSDDVLKLAEGLRSALDKMQVKPPAS